jgi:hypothetical protein
VVRSEGKGPLARTICITEDNIKMDIKLIMYEVMDYIHFVEDRLQWKSLVSTVMSLSVTHAWKF